RPCSAPWLLRPLELLLYMLVEPYFFGRSIGVSQVALLVALGFWTWLWGPIGLVLGTPLTVCLVVLGKHVPSLGFITVIMVDEPALPADVTYYQRLLARDAAEGADILETYLADHSLEQVYDDVLMRALRRAARDREARRVSDEEVRAVYAAARESVESLAKRRHLSSEDPDKPFEQVDSAPLVLGIPVLDEGDEIALVMLHQLVGSSE